MIFDEVITGFRHHLGGYQKICGVIPDITTMGKAMANGYPIAAIAGKREYMSRFNTRDGGDVVYGGTYNGHAVGTSAAIATIEVMEQQPVHEHIFRLGEKMRYGIRQILQILEIQGCVAGYGSTWVTYFMNEEPRNYKDLSKNDDSFSIKYRRELRECGLLVGAPAIRRSAVTFSHTDADVDKTLEIMETALRKVREML